jgi:hypothetical protein
MKLTNKFQLPDAIVRAVQNDSYSKGESDFSATGLLKPPRQTALLERHGHEAEEDVSDRIWSLLGQSVHSICERANVNDLVEKRFFSKFGDYTVSCQIDNMGLDERAILSDFKVTTVYKCKPDSEPDPDWTAQINIQIELLRRNGIEVKAAQIIAILRDWSKNKARTEFNYPPMNVAIIPIEIWPREKTVAFIEQRIALHVGARTSLPECSQEERWAKETKFAVMKKGGKRATKVYDTEAEAKLFVDQDPKNFSVEERPGESVRCALYCSVNKFCSQFQATQNKQSNGEDVA